MQQQSYLKQEDDWQETGTATVDQVAKKSAYDKCCKPNVLAVGC